MPGVFAVGKAADPRPHAPFRRLSYNGEMREPPPRPWIGFPDLPRDAHPPQEGLAQFKEWLWFLIELSPDELLQCEREHPAPPEWQEFYKWAARLHDLHKNLEGVMRGYALIEKMWQSTTLK